MMVMPGRFRRRTECTSHDNTLLNLNSRVSQLKISPNNFPLNYSCMFFFLKWSRNEVISQRHFS